jgi:hypothetical protein
MSMMSIARCGSSLLAHGVRVPVAVLVLVAMLVAVIR